jgi:16S rRNA (cytidine1402-2'-O)-methyltransferase
MRGIGEDSSPEEKGANRRPVPGSLYVVGTPIGNLEDISLRALRILREVDTVAAEDTRRTRKLLDHYGIPTPATSYHEHNEKPKSLWLLQRMLQGETIALVSDAGSPAISDPGYRLIRGAREAGIRVVPVPGPSAPVALLSSCGLPTDRFVFEGFLPRQRGELLRRLQGIRDETRTVVFFEAASRIRRTLTLLAEAIGDRETAIGRELTKLHEEILTGTARELVSKLDDGRERGEFTIAVAGRREEPGKETGSILEEIQALKSQGIGLKEIAVLLSSRTGIPKRRIYQAGLGL